MHDDDYDDHDEDDFSDGFQEHDPDDPSSFDDWDEEGGPGDDLDDDDLEDDAADAWLNPPPRGGQEADEGAFWADAQGDGDLAWRETYHVLFQSAARPTLTQVEACVADADPRLRIDNLTADEHGYFQSVLIESPEDNAAIEVSYEAGEAVIEQSAELAKAMRARLDGRQLAVLLRADARLDVMHFERMGDSIEDFTGEDEMALETLNPAALIAVVTALADLTGGLPVDPTAGELLL